MGELTGQILAQRYRVGRRLGAGAMGAVYRCDHVKVGRPFALKVLHPGLLVNPKHLMRFEREAELAGVLRHPNLVGVLDVGVTPDGLHYIVMEYAEGPTLGAVIDHGAPMWGARFHGIVRQLCAGLQAAHEAGLIHRDFKPDNVIVERSPAGEETVRILDFGIAIPLESAQLDRERLTTAGLVLGTPEYMAPEHASGQPIDHRIDLFALGVICYEMLTGVMPYVGEGVEVALANLTAELPAMSERAPDVEVDPLLEAFTRALLAKKPSDRIATAAAAGELLDLIATDRPAAAAVLGVELPAPPIAIDPEPTAPATARPARPTLMSMAIEPFEALVELPPPDPAAGTRPTLEAGAATLVQPTIPPVPTRAPRRRRTVVAATVAAVAIVAIVFALLRSPSSDAAATASPPVAAHEPAPAPAPQPPAPAPTPVAIPEAKPAPVVEAAPPPQTPAVVAPKPAPVAKVAKPAAPVATEVAPPAGEPTNATISDLYRAVGRRLKSLEERHGDEATYDLWPRYRYIRIADVYTSRAKRLAANDALIALDRDIAARAR